MAYSRLHRPAALGLALAATGTALCLSVSVAWHRVPILREQVLRAAVTILVTLGVHLLPVLVQASIQKARSAVRAMWRLVAGLLWLMGMMWVLYGHATFMLSVQENAGQARAEAVEPLTQTKKSIQQQSSRGLTEIAEETAKIIAEQSRLAAFSCSTYCTSLLAKRAILAARVDALSIEANEVRRLQAERDRQEQAVAREQARRDAARDDAVMAAVSAWMHIPIAMLHWIMAVGLAVFLEGFATLCWVLALLPAESHVPVSRTPDQHTITLEVHDGDDVFLKPASDVPADNCDPDSSYETRLRRARQAVQSGQIKCTVRAVRLYLGCGSDTASSICRMLASEYAA